MENIYREYQKEIRQIQAELKQLPRGYLVKRRRFYYWHLEGTDKGITKTPQLVRDLARKAYLKERLKRLMVNTRAAKIFAKQCRDLSPAEIIGNLAAPYAELPNHYFFNEEEDPWSREAYETLSYHPEALQYLTNAGVATRSKSEMAIGNALEKKHIPYRYEAALKLGASTYYPSFTAKRPLDGKLIFWEHLGLLDRPDYAMNNAKKLSDYANHLIFPGRDLICTNEEDMKDSKRIDTIVDLYFGGRQGYVADKYKPNFT